MEGEIFPPCLEIQPSSMFSIKYMLVLAALLAGAQPSDTEKIRSHHGALSAAPHERTKDTFVISLDAKPIAVFSASAVSLLHVTPLDGVEYTVVELWQPGLNCHNSYAVISVRQRAAEVSPVFGQCSKLHSASHFKGGLQIELQPAARNVLAEDNALEAYWFVNGKIRRLPRPGS